MRLFIIFIAFVVSVGVGLAIWTLTGQEQGDQSTTIVQQPTPTEVAVQEATIFVARRDVPVGRQLTEEDIDRQPWPQHLVLEDFVKEGSEVQLIDMVARTPFKAREPFTFSRLGNPNDPGFLAAQLPKGKRAVTIAIDDISGVNGLVYPGDRVDVLIRHTVGLEQDYKSQEDITPSEDGIPQLPENAQTLAVVGQHQVPVLMNQGKRDAQPVIDLTEVLISNARVLAVGKDSYQYEGAEGNPTNVTLE
ncbi:MAG: Flp pilus assembly protein CpaB, partial [Rickettsiales bacterium]